jgi:hypothetical protein
MNEYEQKQEARKERLLRRADKLDAISNARYMAAKKAVEGIPMGQPILVGHHSERRHRGDLAREDNNMRKSVETSKLAAEARAKASGVGTAGISSDDPDAPAKIAERLRTLERHHEMMLLANRFIRTGNDEGMVKAGWTVEQIAKLKEPALGGEKGFPAYALTNSNANMLRLRKRLASLNAAKTRETKEVMFGDVRVLQNVEENRLQLFFPGKPSDDMRTALKRNGFRWAHYAGAWQRQLTNAAIYAAKYVLQVKQA